MVSPVLPKHKNLMQVKQFDIPICPGVKLLVYSSGAPLFFDENAADFGESSWQLQEGKEYNYELVDDTLQPVDWSLAGSAVMLQENPRHKNCGTIVTGIYVGTSHFKAVQASRDVEVPIDFEIQSIKASYRSDYRHMLSDITSYYTDLVMQQGAPVTQKFEVDFDAPQQTLYQKFAFVRSIVEDEQFDAAIHKIISNPVRKWTETVEDHHIESVKKLSKNVLRQIVSRRDRVPCAGVVSGLSSLPRYISVSCKVDSLDTPENQFVKYVVTSFYGFCSNLRTKRNATPPLCLEIDAVCNVLAGYLNELFFKEVGNPSQLNLGSPVLQRKEGYREVLQAWLMFDLAAKLGWKGGDNVYEAGKKNVAALYEYWLFFKLMECVSDVFHISPEDKQTLISIDSDSLNLDLRQGRTKMIHGSTREGGNRRLNISLYYNRTFSHTSSIQSPGSWTMNMRPDYTLSIWPGEMDEAQAEREDAIVHIHFDAKYRLDKIIIEDKEVDLEASEIELQVEKENRETDIYKRGDLLKMHAYKDAIRRTAGAYILYPGIGTPEKVIKGFHEIIPGLGAFCICPGHEDEQIPALKKFLQDIVRHFMNRTSQREKISVVEHEIYSKSVAEPFFEPFPEPGGRFVFPDSVRVLLASFKDKKQLNWCEHNNKFAVLCSKDGRSVQLDEAHLEVKYVVLYDEKDVTVKHIFKMTGSHPSIVSGAILSKMHYPSPVLDSLYYLYNVSKDQVEAELLDMPWNIGPYVKAGKSSCQIVTYTNLFAKPL